MTDTRIWGWLQPGTLPGFSLLNSDNLGSGLNGTLITTDAYTEYILRDLDGDGIVYDTDLDDLSYPTLGEGIVFDGTLTNAHEIAVYENSIITMNGVDETVRLVVTVTDTGTWAVRIHDEDIQPGWYPADITRAQIGTFLPTEYSGSHVTSVDGMLCFAAETPILTPGGWRRADALRRGDPVMTAGRRFEPLTWTARMTGPALDEASAPIVLDAGVLGLSAPIRLSPQHRVMITCPEANLVFGSRRVLVAARHLLGLPGVCRQPLDRITYVHLKTRRHSVLRTPGLWCESYLPGPMGEASMPPSAWRELMAASRSAPREKSVCRSLTAAEANVLLSRMGLLNGQGRQRGKQLFPRRDPSAPSPARNRSDAPA
ncbi:Hint domain-containing protein [Ponticoccus alexandrii]|uniref:Hedgehog/Intein (Hint) domain-containing protein n=1 Tax=Ponticoccus alexandrii TaxID=1943633 RepID=A0ABX7F4Y6_9RHOB|nr:Hint domain-containing protein [Ponticoccus alexandrii]QRF65174.1 hypothetical protein GQA70_01900 [Ponticoccus alexandrii]